MRCPQGSGIAGTEPLYGISIRQALRFQPEYCSGEPECRELCMHRRGVVGRIDRSRIPKRNVPNRHAGSGKAPRPDVHHRMDGDDDPFLKHRTIEDSGPRRNKRASVDRRTGNVGMWPHEYVIPECTRMLPRASDHRVLHDDTMLANAHRRPLRTDDSASEHHRARPNMDIPRDDSCGCHDDGCINSILKFFQVDITGMFRMTSCARYFKAGVGSSRPNWRWIMCFVERPKTNTSCKALVKRWSLS